MLTGRVVRGAFTRIASLATAGSKNLLRMAPKAKMDASSLTLGRFLGNPMFARMGAAWKGPGLDALRHMQVLGGFGANPMGATKYLTGSAFMVFAKNRGLQPNHGSTDGLGLALFKARHANVL